MHPDRRSPVRHPATPAIGVALAALAALATLALVLAGLAAPVLAKEGLEATLDAPIAGDTPGGTTILVGVTVTVPDGTNEGHRVEGSPISIRLTGPDGTSTWQLAAERGAPGHYEARIVVPVGGVTAVDVGMHGSSSAGPEDLPISILGTALVPGGISPATAQVAPPLAPAVTPVAKAPANPAAAAPADPAPAAGSPAAAPVAAIALVTALGLFALVGAVALVRRARTRARLGHAGPAHGA